MWIYKEFVDEILDQDNIWDQYAFMFSKNRFEIYKEIEKIYSTQKVFEEIAALSKRILQVSERFSV